MTKVKLLDCTLRDGGFLNDWEFGKNHIVSIFNRLNNANVDIVEIGFIDDRRNIDYTRTINPSTSVFDEQFSFIKNKKTMIVAMIDYGTCDIKNITKSNLIDGIRVIFKKKDIDGALAFCKQIKQIGYKVFVQPVSITTYSDMEMLQLIEKVNEIEPYTMSMVDTYGLMHKNNMIKYFYLMDNNLKKSINIGYHSHNNFQLAYSNSIELLNFRTDREIIIDGSLFGMGKSAGNTCTELLAMYFNDNFGKNYEINSLLEAIDVDIISFKEKYDWGYLIPYFMSAYNDCHPKYISYLQDKGTLSIQSINNILSMIDDSEKLSFNKRLIDDLYYEYQTSIINDMDSMQNLAFELKDKKILLLGPGKSIVNDKEKIQNLIKEENPITISINHVSDIVSPNYVFVSNIKRYENNIAYFLDENKPFKVIATSNITAIDNELNYVLNYKNLLNEYESIKDNALALFLKALIQMSVDKVFLAGFDGYEDKSNLYYDDNFEFSKIHRNSNQINLSMHNFIKEICKQVKIQFITQSFYEVDYEKV